jgi:hypothetical protein
VVDRKLGVPTRFSFATVEGSDAVAFWKDLQSRKSLDEWWKLDPREKIRKDTTLLHYVNVGGKLLPTEIAEIPPAPYMETYLRLEWRALERERCGSPPFTADGFPSGLPPDADLRLANKSMGTGIRYKAGKRIEAGDSSPRQMRPAAPAVQKSPATGQLWVPIAGSALLGLCAVGFMIRRRHKE